MIFIPTDTTEHGQDYIKYPDGTLICWGSVSIPIDTKGQTNGNAGVNFPRTFSTVGHVSLTNTYANTTRIMWSSAGITSAGFKAYFFTTATLDVGHRATALWLAIGRWK